jgi:PAS domain S-box-containing protein
MVTLDMVALGSHARLQAVDRARRTLPVTPLRLDAIARLAARLLDAPMAAVTLVARDVDQFLGQYGMPEPFATMRSVPLEYSLCAYVVSADEVVAVGDLLAEEELADHPAAVEYGIRAFAGMPFRDGRGQLVAAVTVFDVEPRAWTGANLAALGHIAELLDRIPVEDDPRRLVVAALAPDPATLVSPAGEAEVRRGFITALLDSLQAGVVAFDNDGRPVLFNRALRRLYGLPDDLPMSEALADAYRQLHHVDGTPVRPEESVMARALHGETVRDAEAVLHDDRLPNRWLLTNGQPICGADGGQLGAVATVLDVTERRRGDRFRDCELAVARRLNASRTVAEAAPELVARVGETLEWTRLELWLADGAAGVLRSAAVWEPGADPAPAPIRCDAAHPVARAWRSGEPVWVFGLGAAGAEAVRGSLCVPVRTAHAVGGVLACLSPHDEPAPAPVISLLTGVAGLLGDFLDRLTP